MKKSISILGCGYLGKKLIPYLYKDFNLHISTRSSQISQPRVETYSIDLTKKINPSSFWSSETLIILVPPYEKIEDDFLKFLSFFKGQHIIFTSSISVFKNNQGEVTEETTPLGNQSLISAEKVLLSSPHRISILRLGGLADEVRRPWVHLEGKSKEYDEWLHLVHVKNCIQAIKSLCLSPKYGIFHMVNDQRVLKSSFYEKKCKIPPKFGKLLLNAKKVSNRKSIQELEINYLNL